MKKRVGVDFHVVDGIFQGSRTYLIGLYSRLVNISPDFEFYFFLDNPDALRAAYPVFNRENVHLVRMHKTNPIKRLCYQLPMMQRKYSLDIFHTQYIMPMPSYCPCVVTIHDILFESCPQYFSFAFRLRSRLLVRLSARKAAHIFTISDYSRDDIIKRYNVSGAKTTTVYLGYDEDRFLPGAYCSEVITKRGLTSGNYILSVGRLEPRKNHVSILRAYAASDIKNIPLVIVGQQDFGYDEIFKTVNQLGIGSRVLFLQDVGDADIPAFYRHAMMFVYPSLAEGFGLPVLEAMASGIPVITSNTTSIPEVAGDACILFDPLDADGMARTMGTLAQDERLRLELSKKGIERAAQFTWEKTAKNVRGVYLRLLSDNGSDA